MCIAIITARLGSKRLPKKNIKNFEGKPVIYYPIKTCLKAGIFRRVIVSTESRLISSISKKYGAEIPFLRSKKFADDKTNTLALMNYLVKKMKLNKNQDVCCLYPVTPLITVSLLKKAYKKFKKSRYDFLVPVVRANKLEKRKFKLDYHSKIVKNHRSKYFFKDSGQFYFGKANSFKKNKSILFSGSTIGYKISKNHTVDVNTLDDWIKLKKIYKKN